MTSLVIKDRSGRLSVWLQSGFPLARPPGWSGVIDPYKAGQRNMARMVFSDQTGLILMLYYYHVSLDLWL